jgi:EAL domain-containing protein (putative c-di-GMP-specific phosphodiesterase class I)
MFKELKDLGLRLSMDDFGTGYSSLSLLRQLPFDSLKLDRSFIDKMDTDSREAGLVKHIIALAYELGLKVTAEGVEREAQLKLLQEMECTHAQGYYFSRPVPGAEATKLLSIPVRSCTPSEVEVCLNA